MVSLRGKESYPFYFGASADLLYKAGVLCHNRSDNSKTFGNCAPPPCGGGWEGATLTDHKLPHTTNNQSIDYYLTDITSAQDYYPFGMLKPGRSYSSNSYRFGFGGKEKDDEWHGSTGTVYDYGFRIYDARLARFLSVDPLSKSFPYYTPYQFAGNCPIKFIDLDGLEAVDPSVEKFYKDAPKINMNNAPAGSSTNAAGYKRNGPWFWREMLKNHPEMFDADNVAAIKQGRAPIVNDKWVQYNPTHLKYKGIKLQHHHIKQGNMAAGIPKKVHYDYFKEIHPNLKANGDKLKGSGLKGALGGSLMVVGGLGDIAGILNGNPDSWINLFPCIGCDPANSIGKVGKEPNSGLYYTITGVENTFNGEQLTRKTITYDIYDDYAWDEEEKKYVGVDLIESRTEVWDYDKNGNIKETVLEPSM